MGSPLLSGADDVRCPNGGKAALVVDGRVRLGGTPVALAATATTMEPGCSLQAPCATVSAWVMPSARIRVGATPVLLAATTAVCQNGSPAAPVSAGQHRVTGL